MSSTSRRKPEIRHRWTSSIINHSLLRLLFGYRWGKVRTTIHVVQSQLGTDQIIPRYVLHSKGCGTWHIGKQGSMQSLVQSDYKSFVSNPSSNRHFYSKTNQMHQCIKFTLFLEWHSTCFGRSFRSLSGVQDCTYSNRHLSNSYCCLLASG